MLGQSGGYQPVNEHPNHVPLPPKFSSQLTLPQIPAVTPEQRILLLERIVAELERNLDEVRDQLKGMQLKHIEESSRPLLL